MRERAIFAIRWVAAASCPLWLGVLLLGASFELWRLVSQIVYPEDDMGMGPAKVLYLRRQLIEPFFLTLLVAVAIGVLAPRWKFRASLAIALVPLVLVLSYGQLENVLRGVGLFEDVPTAVESGAGILGAGLGCLIVLKVFGRGKEAV